MALINFRRPDSPNESEPLRAGEPVLHRRSPEGPPAAAVDQLRTLQAEYESWRDQLPESLADSRLFLRGPGRPAQPCVRRLADVYRRAFAADPFDPDDGPDRGGSSPGRVSPAPSGRRVHDSSGPALDAGDPVMFLVVDGPLAGPLLGNEAGTHLVVDKHGSLVPVQVGALPAGEADGPLAPGRCVGERSAPSSSSAVLESVRDSGGPRRPQLLYGWAESVEGVDRPAHPVNPPSEDEVGGEARAKLYP